MKKDIEDLFMIFGIVIFFMFAAYQEESARSNYYLEQSVKCSCEIADLEILLKEASDAN